MSLDFYRQNYLTNTRRGPAPAGNKQSKPTQTPALPESPVPINTAGRKA
ncbi:hypothetical protein SMSP2_00279 [Limihaloglobus sulfuriphilus]|uniref:Uncharacterized protein n=1 Tax=Limihaloglobus sulfuriphilus TaxID=1851148 RepID=A0A1Q2MB40_9BACT|nr:hypothetical protein [Limihaloglobus sulfuriphilus]AQQ69945.1 hypothetical protein SMSP2_00279 [Limihaloglobus sulfuriphilus]